MSAATGDAFQLGDRRLWDFADPFTNGSVVANNRGNDSRVEVIVCALPVKCLKTYRIVGHGSFLSVHGSRQKSFD